MNEMSRRGMRGRVLVVAVMVLMAPLVFLGIAVPGALAAPEGVFAVFAQCPTSIPGVALCQYAEITSGEFAIGSLRVPIDRKIVLQGGAIRTGSSNFNEYFEIPATNGESISKTELEIPGGLRTLIDCDAIRDRWFDGVRRRHGCGGVFGHHRGEVGAIVESAASLSNPVIQDFAALGEEKGAGVVFPVRLHLQNSLLGDGCYIGSEASPIELRLTDGTTSPPPPGVPIKGSPGIPASEIEEGFEALTTTNSTLVDNAFSVPVAEGCGADPGLVSVIDTRIDQALGLESGAGRNTAILTGTHRLAEVEAVLASEKFPTKEEPTPPPPPHHHHHHWWPTH